MESSPARPGEKGTWKNQASDWGKSDLERGRRSSRQKNGRDEWQREGSVSQNAYGSTIKQNGREEQRE